VDDRHTSSANWLGEADHAGSPRRNRPAAAQGAQVRTPQSCGSRAGVDGRRSRSIEGNRARIAQNDGTIVPTERWDVLTKWYKGGYFTREVTLRLPRLSFMSIQAVVLASASVVAGASALTSSQAPQQSEQRLTVLASNAMKGVLQDVVPGFERESGRRVVITYGPAAVLARQIDKGDRFDLAILTPGFVDAAVRSGAISRDAVVTIARSPIALVIRRGAGKPDIRTANALRATLMNSRAIASAREGASGPFFSELL